MAQLMTFIVTQLGARMHYAVPRILQREGQLEHLFTDICASSGWPRWCGLVPSALQPDGLRRVAARLPAGIPGHRVTGFNILGLRYAQRRRRARTPTDLTAAYVWAGRSICQRVVRRGLDGACGYPDGVVQADLLPLRIGSSGCCCSAPSMTSR
jgi:hypothetical protein